MVLVPEQNKCHRELMVIGLSWMGLLPRMCTHSPCVRNCKKGQEGLNDLDMVSPLGSRKRSKGGGHTRCPPCAPPMRLILLPYVLTQAQAVLDILTGLKMLGTCYVMLRRVRSADVCRFPLWKVFGPTLGWGMLQMVALQSVLPGCQGGWHWICRKVACTGQKMAQWSWEAPRLMGRTFETCLGSV